MDETSTYISSKNHGNEEGVWFPTGSEGGNKFVLAEKGEVVKSIWVFQHSLAIMGPLYEELSFNSQMARKKWLAIALTISKNVILRVLKLCPMRLLCAKIEVVHAVPSLGSETN